MNAAVNWVPDFYGCLLLYMVLLKSIKGRDIFLGSIFYSHKHFFRIRLQATVIASCAKEVIYFELWLHVKIDRGNTFDNRMVCIIKVQHFDLRVNFMFP